MPPGVELRHRMHEDKVADSLGHRASKHEQLADAAKARGDLGGYHSHAARAIDLHTAAAAIEEGHRRHKGVL